MSYLHPNSLKYPSVKENPINRSERLCQNEFDAFINYGTPVRPARPISNQQQQSYASRGAGHTTGQQRTNTPANLERAEPSDIIFPKTKVTTSHNPNSASLLSSHQINSSDINATIVDDISEATPDVRSSSACMPEITSLEPPITPPQASHVHSWATLSNSPQALSHTLPSPASLAHLALPPVSYGNTRPTQTNIRGDLTKPPIRPPSPRPGQSEQTDAVPSLLGPDIAERAQAASEAARPPQAPLTEQELADGKAALAKLLARANRGGPTKNRDCAAASTLPLPPALPVLSTTIDSASFRTPEAVVTECEVNLTPAHPAHMPRSISRQEMNKTWLLSTPTAKCLQATVREVAPVPRSPTLTLPHETKPNAALTNDKPQAPSPRAVPGGGEGVTNSTIESAAGPPQDRTEAWQQAPREEPTSAPPQLSTDLGPRTSPRAPTQGTAEAPILAPTHPGHGPPIAPSQMAQNSIVEAPPELIDRPASSLTSEKRDWGNFTFTDMCGSLDLPAGSILTDSNRSWRASVTTTMEPDGGLLTRITAAPTSQPLSSILMAEHMAYVAKLDRRDKRRAQQARKQPVEGIHVPTTYTTHAQSWCIHINVPMGPRWDALIDEGYAMCGNATVHDMRSFEALVGCVVSLFDSAGSSSEDSAAPPLSLKDSEWPDLGSTSDAPTHGPGGPAKAEPAQPSQGQARWTLGDFADGVISPGQSHPPTRQAPDPLTWRRKAIAAHPKANRHATAQTPTGTERNLADNGSADIARPGNGTTAARPVPTSNRYGCLSVVPDPERTSALPQPPARAPRTHSPALPLKRQPGTQVRNQVGGNHQVSAQGVSPPAMNSTTQMTATSFRGAPKEGAAPPPEERGTPHFPRSRPIALSNRFQALSDESDDPPRTGTGRGFQAPRRAPTLSRREEFAGQLGRASKGPGAYEAPAAPRVRLHGVRQSLMAMAKAGPISSRIPLLAPTPGAPHSTRQSRARHEPRDGRVVRLMRNVPELHGQEEAVEANLAKASLGGRAVASSTIPAGKGAGPGAAGYCGEGQQQMWAGSSDERSTMSSVRPEAGPEPRLGVEDQEATSCAPQPAASTPEVPSSLRTPGMPEPDPHPSQMTHNSMHTETQRGVSIRVREGRSCHEFEITELDWSAVDHARFGPSVDLVVSLRLREHLGRSDLVRVDLLTADHRDMDRGDWPATWGELVSSVEIGVSFRAGLRLRAGMDPAMAAELNALRFTPDLDWTALEQGYDCVRSQQALPAEFPPPYKRMAELMAAATQLYQWEPMMGVSAQGTCSPARMAALKIILDRQRGDTARPIPPWIQSGGAGQVVSLRLNSIPPPQGIFTSGGAAARDAIKEWLLEQLDRAFPDLSATLAAAHLGVDFSWVRKNIQIEGDLENLQDFSMVLLLPAGRWVSALLSQQVLLGGGYCTASPVSTHSEVCLTASDQAVFRSMRLSLRLGPTASLWMLEDGLTRAFPGSFVSCRFTTCRLKDGRGKKRAYEHFTLDDDRSLTMMTIGAESLIIARRRQLFVTVPFGADGQFPVSLAFRLPTPAQHPLYVMVTSQACPPLRARLLHTLFLSDRVLLGPLPEGWTAKHLDEVTEVTLESLRRDTATMCLTFLRTVNVQFVGRREHGKGRNRMSRDRSPLFLYLEFQGVEEAKAFGHLSDSQGLPAEFYQFWDAYIGEQAEMWSCMVILEALAVVSPDKWPPLLDLGRQKPCPLPPPPNV